MGIASPIRLLPIKTTSWTGGVNVSCAQDIFSKGEEISKS